MTFSMAPLLVHSDTVPAKARRALQRALRAPPERRTQLLESAARAIWRHTDLDCAEIRDLIGVD